MLRSILSQRAKSKINKPYFLLLASPIPPSFFPSSSLTYIVNMPETLAVVLDQGHHLLQLIALLLRRLHVPVQGCVCDDARKRKRKSEFVLAGKVARQITGAGEPSFSAPIAHLKPSKQDVKQAPLRLPPHRPSPPSLLSKVRTSMKLLKTRVTGSIGGLQNPQELLMPGLNVIRLATQLPVEYGYKGRRMNE